MSTAAKKLSPAPQHDLHVVHVAPELKPILPQFLEDKHKDMDAIARGLKSGNLTPARIAGHQMKGIAVNFGFPVLSEIGEALERAAENGKASEVRALLDRMREYLAHVEIRFDGEPL